MILLACLASFQVRSQTGGAFEQLYYTRADDGASIVPMVHYTTKNNWYGAARYNYDEARTFALYAGRTFSGRGDLSYSATPMVGGLMGKMNGGSVGMNVDLDFENLFFSTQSQYSFSLEEKTNKYFFTWSELGYQATPWLYGGMALQQTNAYHSAVKFEPGCMIGLSVKRWTVPLYIFNQAGGDPYFVMGINWAWEKQKKNNTPDILAVNGEK